MEKEIAEGKFIEHANVHGNIYGTSFESVMKVVNNNKICILDIDVQGARQIRQAAESDPVIKAAAQFILIAPPDMPSLAGRLRNRNTESEEQLKLRIDAAANELKNYRLYDFIVVNDDLDKAADDLISVFKAIRLRTANIQEELFQ